MASKQLRNNTRLQASLYYSPYTRLGAPADTAARIIKDDPYAELRGQALTTLESEGFDPETMIERGLSWASDQDPFAHLNQARTMEFVGDCMHRVAELNAGWLTAEDYEGMIKATGIFPVASTFQTTFKRQTRYPDSIIVAFRQETVEKDRQSGLVVLFSLQQQKIVVEARVSTVFVDGKTGRPVDVSKGPGGWPKMHAEMLQRCKDSQALKKKSLVAKGVIGKAKI